MRGKPSYPLRPYEPFSISKNRYSIPAQRKSCTHRLHTENDELNRELHNERKIIIERSVDGKYVPLFRVEDLNEIFKRESYRQDQDEGLEANVRGLLAERIGRQDLKEILLKQRYGRIMGLFDTPNDPESRYWLVADSYPNIYLHDNEEKRCISEIDGLFHYRHSIGTRKKRAYNHHLFILESKVGDIALDIEHLLQHVIIPLRELKPKLQQTLVLTGQSSDLFTHQSRQILQPALIKIYRTLQEEGVRTAFIPFKESPTDFEVMTQHIMTHYFWKHDMPRMLPLKIRKDSSEMHIYNGGQSPLLRLVRDPSNPKAWLETDP